ncbi:hypothetical protein Mapa_013673 [Marchantia paleacea]|nr:hypothetical protein Mapa_013673 [Marchantia paleacea]
MTTVRNPELQQLETSPCPCPRVDTGTSRYKRLLEDLRPENIIPCSIFPFVSDSSTVKTPCSLKGAIFVWISSNILRRRWTEDKFSKGDSVDWTGQTGHGTTTTGPALKNYCLQYIVLKVLEIVCVILFVLGLIQCSKDCISVQPWPSYQLALYSVIVSLFVFWGLGRNLYLEVKEYLSSSNTALADNPPLPSSNIGVVTE